MRKNFIFTLLALALIVAFGLACTKPAPKSTDLKPAIQIPQEKPAENTPPIADNSGNQTDTQQPGIQNPPTPVGTSPVEGQTFTGKVPPNWPKDVPIMEGLEISTGIINPPPENVLEVFCYGPLKIGDVWNFYSKLPGWEKDSSKQGKESGDLRELNLMKGNESLFIGITVDPSGTIQMTLRYQPENKAPEKTN